jgi:hypothetical protein
MTTRAIAVGVLMLPALASCGNNRAERAARETSSGPTLTVGEERTFAASAVEPGSEIACVNGPARAVGHAPAARARATTFGVDAISSGGYRASIELSVRPDGALVARCNA